MLTWGRRADGRREGWLRCQYGRTVRCYWQRWRPGPLDREATRSFEEAHEEAKGKAKGST